MHKIEETLNIGGKKDEHKGETQGGYNQQEHRGDAHGQRKEGFVDQMKDKIPGGGGGGGGGMTQGGYNQQEHRGGAQGEPKDFLILDFILSFYWSFILMSSFLYFSRWVQPTRAQGRRTR